jgi:hypothetical protein
MFQHVEESDMWAQRKSSVEGYKPLRRAHMDKEEPATHTSPVRVGDRRSTYWARELQRAEETDPDRSQ